jgi:hypothetical protein
MSFWNEYEASCQADALERGGQNDTAGVCAFCGTASDDVLLGVCGECVEP